MLTEHFDFIVIGGGSGGYAAARTARETREKVAIVDSAQSLGGLCILQGCMPSKTLIYSSEVLHLAQKGKAFGLDIPAAAINMPALHLRKLDIIKEFSDYRQAQLESERFTLFRNRAKFIDHKTIELDDGRQLTADHFMIATGSTVSVPALPGLSEAPCWTSDDVLELDFMPEKVVVLGGGIVACELAQFLRRIGSEVIQIQRSASLLKDFPPMAAVTVERAFLDEGIQLYTNTKLQSISYAANEFTVNFQHQNEMLTIRTPHVFNALGRRPASGQLGLDKAGIETADSGHIICDAMQRTSNFKVYACGDVTGPYEVVHLAIMQGETAAKHATGRPTHAVEYDSKVSVAFTDPQIATVGLSENQLKERGIAYFSADYPFDDHGKSILMEAKYGYVKVYADELGTVLGAECVSKDAGELIHTMAVAISLSAKVQDLVKVHWYHPTLSEIWSYPLEDIADELQTTGGVN